VRDGAVGVGSFDVESEGWAVRGVAQLALQAGVRLHVGVACPELVGKPLEGVRDADAQGAEALAVALKGYFKGRSAANQVVEEVTPTGGVSLSVCPPGCHCSVWMLCPKTFLSTCVNRRLPSLISQRQSTP
jgi:hypothetical protein